MGRGEDRLRIQKRIQRWSVCGLFLWLAGSLFSAQAQTIPSAPTNLLANAVLAGQINLTWSNTSTNQDGFKIERSTDGTNFTQIAQVLPNTAVYRDTALWPATTYIYRVHAYNSGGDSAVSNMASASTPALCTPTSVTGWGSNGAGQLSPPAGLTNLVMIAAGEYYALALTADHLVIGWGGNELGQATPPPGLTGVVSIAGGGYWRYGDVVGGHSLALKSDGTVVGWGNNSYGQATPPAGLSNVVAISAGGFHSLALKSDGTVVGWGENDFQQATSPPGLQGVVAIAAGGGFSVALESDGTVVGWGYNAGGAVSIPDGTTGVVAIATGQDFTLALKSDGTVIGWGYCTYGQCPAPAGLSNVIAIAAAAQHSAALKSDGTVVAFGSNVSGESTLPAGLSGVTGISLGELFSLVLQSALNAPSSLTATAVSSNQINLAWTDNSNNEDGFAIERALDNGGAPGTWTQIAAVNSNITTFSDTGLSENITYWYRVRAFNAATDSYYSNEATAIIPLPPAAPSSLTAMTANQINLSWTDNANNEDGFKIERAPDNSGSPGAWAQIATVAANVTTYTDTGLLVNTVYWYRVRAYNVSADSDYSNQASAITPAVLAPSGLIATAISTNQINLSWTDNSDNEDGFKVERALDIGGHPDGWVPIAKVSSNVTAYSDTGVAANTTYWYRVRAYNTRGISAPSNQVSATTPALCPRLVVGWGDNTYGKATPPAGLAGVVALAAADYHSLALKSDGTVVGWGNSYYATPPPGLSNVVAISAQFEHSLALKSDGSVTNWGYGSPTPPVGLSNVIAIAAGEYQDLALKANGTVVSWGSGGTVPTGLSNVVAIAAGYYVGLALKSDGTVVSWGGSTLPSGLTNIVSISAYNSQCLALKSDGTVIAWGGQNPPSGLSNVVAIAAGSYYCLALKNDGTVVGWGNNYAGQATPPAGLARVVAIAAGGSHSLALTLPCAFSAPSALTATAVFPNQINLTWLDNSTDESGFKIERSTDGTNFTQIAQLLPNTTSYRNTGPWPGTTYYYRVRAYSTAGDEDPSNVASAGTPAACISSIVDWGGAPPPPLGLTNVVALSPTAYIADLALESDGTILRWGNGPVPPPGPSTVVSIAGGYEHGLGLKSDSTVVGWGAAPAATPPAGLSNVVAIAAGYYHSLALKSDGTVIGWGINSDGQTNVPAGLTGVVAIAAGWYHSLALKSDGRVVCWGRNDFGQATPPAWLRGVTAIAGGFEHSLALTSYGTVVGWGNNNLGQTNVPSGLSGVVAVGAGYYHSLVLKGDGTVLAWGSTSFNETNIPAGLSAVTAITAGTFHSVAMSCAPSAPSALIATTISTNRIDLIWTDNSINETRFGIERATSYFGPWTEIGSVNPDVTTYPDTGLSCGQTYYYRVRAYDAAGGSPYSSIASANTSPNDLDCDGIADAWTQQYFGHPYGQASDNSRATDDADGDGFTNLQEYLAGTDPTNPASAFRVLDIAAEDGDVFITWEAVGGKWYVVQTATNFAGGLADSFYDLDPAIQAPGTNEYPLTVVHFGGATNGPIRFYRVRLGP